ncbi:rhodanese-like domain-containing protein [Rhodoblastus acidophilus]|jgi:rhodanese-related sulfurtransferase|uniref:Rhodanese-like domain-containing protein n=1 Tax=Candidatus Rhodoblastus alkanivorans TaxID=2954117 RepID=A0ABS9ZAG5_9HYPH|nr:rhodanese-like domain-containing protein [Candidatus Rhodoblastus alkanivorans]MCI4679327.1 rhodanese-like domain-containing protein [Candidatus Rhodoblastus alkanivorans]MCI4684046.1 rhodanese-like domain-containing protein [Candidatus Rhodoblastus alkanivorans]MDI4641366.1 rhodanese-like domain-containing protein [Rhodoblastus acidophilus]
MTLKRPLKKGFKQMLAEANALIETISVHDALPLVGEKSILFLDVREAVELQKGEILGALHAPRGFLEFYADPDSTMHKPEMARAEKIILYCATGGRSTFAAKTLVDMGYDLDKIFNLAGGFEAWKAANGPIEVI